MSELKSVRAVIVDNDLLDVGNLFMKMLEVIEGHNAFSPFINIPNGPELIEVTVYADHVGGVVTEYVGSIHESEWTIEANFPVLEEIFDAMLGTLNLCFPGICNLVPDLDDIGCINATPQGLTLYIGDYNPLCKLDYHMLENSDDKFYQLPIPIASNLFGKLTEFLDYELKYGVGDESDDGEDGLFYQAMFDKSGEFSLTFMHADLTDVSGIHFGTEYARDEFFVNVLEAIQNVASDYQDINWDDVTKVGVSPNGFYIS